MLLPVKENSYRRASVAMRTARPASTVPINQRWTVSHSGRDARNAAIDPAINAIIALTVTLTAICVNPSAIDCVNTLPCSGIMNCGNSDRYSTAAFGFSRLVSRPIANSRRELS